MSNELEKDKRGLEMRIGWSGYTLWLTSWLEKPIVEASRFMVAWDLDPHTPIMRCDDGRSVDLGADDADRLRTLLSSGTMDEWAARRYLMITELRVPTSSWMSVDLPILTNAMVKFVRERDMKRVQEMMDK